MRDVIAPGLRYSQNVYEEKLCRTVAAQTHWLDVGCGHQVLSEWRLDAERDLVSRAAYCAGVDPDAAAINKHRTISNIHVGTVEALPFPPSRFDLVTANMVVEHLSDPAGALAEIFRVLRPGGMFLFHTPNEKGYIVAVAKLLPHSVSRVAARLLDGRKEEDVYPTYYRCNSEGAITEAARASGFEVELIQHIPTAAVFVRVPPIACIELLWIRATMREGMSSRRTNIIAVLRKPGVPVPPSGG
jgi:ubiquinone/menaquinone biosynthesis C-methylase UbiE